MADPIRSYKEFKRRYLPDTTEQERRKRLSIEERAQEDGEETARVALALLALLIEHGDCRLEEVGSCVYCADHNVRLYQGELVRDGGTDD